MKKRITIRIPEPHGHGPQAFTPIALTIEGGTPQQRNRLAAYIEQFDAAEATVLGFRGKTTQLVELWADEVTANPSLYRAWIGSQFAGTVLAPYEEKAVEIMRKHLLDAGYTKHSLRNLKVTQSVAKWPTKDLTKHLEAQP